MFPAPLILKPNCSDFRTFAATVSCSLMQAIFGRRLPPVALLAGSLLIRALKCLEDSRLIESGSLSLVNTTATNRSTSYRPRAGNLDSSLSTRLVVLWLRVGVGIIRSMVGATTVNESSSGRCAIHGLPPSPVFIQCQ